ncbi:hypothetical protein OHB41_38750 [Streptomyces sp. NBC_01571]|uniref:hypothetical protein n=1 Tax=Streptomyces sp. NBC_01571 TaxID=2975883 RepID=UPI002251A0D7|nr:hypothetical protein [Streptomyces sp. NBC_01571]MCX4579023.1 hypothetical protein [Streptomyces sp. NBC_01571]
MNVPRDARLRVAVVMLGLCMGALGAGAGWLLNPWWGPGAGFAVGGVLFLLNGKVWFDLCTRHVDEVLNRLKGCGVEEEATAYVLMRAVLLYEAAVFTHMPGGVSLQERASRRTVAYQFASYESLPRQVRVAAAEALEAIDGSEDVDHVRAVVQTLSREVRACRPMYIHVSGSQTS